MSQPTDAIEISRRPARGAAPPALRVPRRRALRLIFWSVAGLLTGSFLAPGSAIARRRGGLRPGFRHRRSRGSYGRRGHRRYRGYGGYYGGYGYYGRRYGPGFGFGYGYGGPHYWGYSRFYWPYYGPSGWIYLRHHDHYSHDHRYVDRSGRQYSAPTATEKGWELLARGSEKRALSVFAKEAETDPSNALAKLGYAVSSAELGHHDLSVMAMRRAARTDARAFAAAPVDARLRERILDLVDAYHAGDHGEDAHFMAASLLLAAGEVEAAGQAVDYAIDDGDSDESTRSLKRAIQSVAADLEREPADEGAGDT